MGVIIWISLLDVLARSYVAVVALDLVNSDG